MPECPGSHCSNISDRVNRVCKSDGFSGTVVYVLMADGTECYCKCSCLAYNTPVAVGPEEWVKIQDFRVGDSVLVAKPSSKTFETAQVAFSDGTPGDGNPVPYTIFLRTESGVSLIVTADHPFLVEGGKLKRADRLTPEDKLVNEYFQPVGIIELGYGTYTGGIHNISTSTGGPGEPVEDHLINTAGVISGDYYAQLFLVEEAMLSEPQIGAVEYTERWSDSRLDSAGATMNRLAIAETGVELFKFKPAQPFTPPPGAVSFLPDHMSVPLPGMLQPLDDSVPLEIAEDLVAHFKVYYPNVVYHIEWLDNTVNAYAWRQNGQRHVALLGGIIRHRAIQRQGLGLILAHELGHHYGGPPLYPENGLSCEGQADYWGASVGMRAVWRGVHYFEEMRPAIDQLFNLFAHGVVRMISEEEEEKIFVASAGCAHPPATCRRDTYIAGMRLDLKPACAG